MIKTPLTETLYYIMLSVKEPNYGYEIMESIRKMTNGRIDMGAGTLYGGIKILLEKGYIALYSEELEFRKKKEYVLTKLGREVIDEEIIRLNELIKNGKEIMNYDNV